MVLIGLFYALVHNPFGRFVEPDAFDGYLGLIARVTGGILDLLGQGTSVHGTIVESPEYSMRVVRGCDAIEPIAAFVAAVLASPISFWTKLPGILAGAVALSFLNLIRLVTLFLVGVYAPSAVDFVHFDVWQAAFIVLAICFWAVWVQWATRHLSAARAEAG